MAEPRTVADRLRHWEAKDPDAPVYIFRRGDGSRYVMSRRDVMVHSQRFSWRLRSLGLGTGHVVCNTLLNSPERVATDLGILLAGALSAPGMPFLADGSDLRHTLKLAEVSALLADPDVPGATWTLCQQILAASGSESSCLATVTKDAAAADEVRHSEDDVATVKSREMKEGHPEADRDQGGCKKGGSEVSGLQVVRVSDPDLPSLQMLLLVRRQREDQVALFEALAGEPSMPPVALAPDSTAVLFCTSGTTGFSKMASVAHQTLSRSDAMYHEAWLQQLTETGIHYNDEILGLVAGWPNLFMRYGVTQVLIDLRGPKVEDYLGEFWRSVVEEKCDYALVAPYVPSMLAARRDLWEGSSHRPRVFFTGGAPPSAKSLDVVGRATDCLVQVYGSSESNVIAYQVYDTRDHVHRFMAGTVAVGVEARVVDDDLNDLPIGQEGEILIRSIWLFSGYYNQPQETAKAFTQDGWCRTNDQGYYDDQGRLNVMGRCGDVILKSGYNIHPAWLETEIAKVKGVKAVAVVAVPDPDTYHEICACVEPVPGSQVSEETLRACCDKMVDSQQDADVTPPRYYLLMESLPRTGRGKLDRKTLRVKAAERLGLTPEGSTHPANITA